MLKLGVFILVKSREIEEKTKEIDKKLSLFYITRLIDDINNVLAKL